MIILSAHNSCGIAGIKPMPSKHTAWGLTTRPDEEWPKEEVWKHKNNLK